MIKRSEMGNLLGYVRLPRGHRLRGRGTFAIDRLFRVHGGVTWSGPNALRDCYNKRGWWVGFDCAHSFDYVPGLWQLYPRWADLFPDAVYRDWAYVRSNVESLAAQLKARE
jgi:hypothetical protein